MPDHFTDENEGEPVAWRHHGPMGGWITTEEKQSWSEQPLYAHPDPAVERLERELNCCQMQLTDAEADRERLQRELDEARGIVRNIYWMACRYADGRNTYAPGMYNRAIAKAYDAGWLTFDHTGRRYEVQYARDGMSPEWKTAEERAISAEASLAKAIAERDEARAKADENWKLAEYEQDQFASTLVLLVSREVAASRGNQERLAFVIERLSASLGFTVALAANGHGPTIDTLIAGAEQYAHQEAVARSGFAGMMHALRGDAP